MRIVPALLALAVFCSTLGLGRAPAAPLTWDPLGNNGGAGSGNWDTTAGNTNWWNGTADVPWTQSSTTASTNIANFNGQDAAPGTYLVTLDSTQVAVTNLNINNSGYTFNGPNPIYIGANEFLNVAAGKAVTFNCNMSGSGTAPCWVLGAGSTMNVAGNITSGQQVHLAGTANSAFNLTGVNAPAIMFVQAPVFVTSGSVIPSSSFYIGYNQTLPAPNSTAYNTGSFTISNATFSLNGNVFILARGAGNGTLTMQNGSSVNVGTTAAHPLAINYDGNAANVATLNVDGGTLTVGSSTLTAASSAIDFFDTGEATGSTAVMIQTNGVVYAWGGILFGAGSGTPASATLINSGGTLYLGKNGISLNTVPPVVNLALSGGTIGALANWSSSVPMTLTNLNGNITFQCADNNGNPNNITLSGPLTGVGGLNVTGTGTLTLSGANNYAGTTVVSNGALAVVTGSAPQICGPVTVDGSAGSPVVSVAVSSPGQYWTNSGTLTFQNGTPAAAFQFGSLAPSTSVAAIHVGGGVAFTATPNVTVAGSAIAVGTYPLIAYTGALSGTMPTALTLPGYISAGYLTNFAATKTIALVVSSSTYNPADYWGVGNGVWDVNTTANWKQFGSPAKYVDGNAVVFDDSASGTSPITVTLNTTVNPLDVVANNSAKSYTITGTGSISGPGNLSVQGGGTLTLGGTNAYSGGTVISAGQVNINNGGNATASPIGTGTLTLNAGAVVDNTSGSDVTLQAPIPEIWNGNFTYAGSTNNFNTGAGSVTMNSDIAITVGGNNFTVSNNISDNGANLQLTKAGPGALTLPVGNSFGGGLKVASGLVNLGDPNAAGSGVFTISGGAIDNISGAEFILTPASFIWSGSFSFIGSTNLDLYGSVAIPNGLGSITLNVASNTLTTMSDIVNNNTTVIKTGNGTWDITGSAAGQSLGLVVSAGQVDLSQSGGQAITGGNNVGLTVQSNALVLDNNSYQIHSDTAVPLPVSLAGGTWDLNGQNENVDELFLSGGGTLRNGAPASTSTLDLVSGHPATLTGGNGQFDVEAVDGVLNLKGVIAGGGSLLKLGLGVLNLESNNVYTGGTVVSNGTLALPGVSSIATTAGIYLATTNAALDLSHNTDTNGNPTPVLTLLSGQTLSGFGTVTGLVQLLNGAVLAPGAAATVGTLSVTGVAGTNTLAGTTMIKLDQGNLTNDQLSVSGSLQYGGILTLTNLSGSLTNGNSFVLFNAAGGYSGAFAGLSPSRPGYPNFGLAWNTNNLAVNGTISVVTAAVPPPPNITTVSLAGTTLTIRGTNGVPTGPFALLETTNLASANWVPVLTTNFDGTGDFSVSVSVTNSVPQQFYKLMLQ
jgi:autotransporter-associated beta strand protein